MNYTDNYNLRKPELTDPVDIDDLNYNADAIDGKLKEIEDWEAAHLQESNPHSITPALIGAETPTGAQQKANQAETSAKSYADIVANNALNSARDYADGVLASANSYTDQVASDLSQSVETAVQEISAELVTHKADTMPHKFEDLKNTVTYKFGFQLSAEGNPQIIFEEVV